MTSNTPSIATFGKNVRDVNDEFTAYTGLEIGKRKLGVIAC
jgi:hypothetical protein